jgi:lipoprotein-releasing system permease protein
MSPSLRIAVRFLISKKRSMVMSLAGIVFGVGFFILTQAQTSGFELFFIRTILGTDGAIRIEDRLQDTIRSLKAGGEGNSRFSIAGDREGLSYISGVAEPRLMREALNEFPTVTAISGVLRGNVVLEGIGKKKGSAQVYGIDLDDHLAVSDLESQIIQGGFEEFRNNPMGILIGKKMADIMQVSIGGSVVLEAHRDRRRYRIAAIYETGVTDIDKSRVFMQISEARSLLQKPHGVSFMQLNLTDRNRDKAPEVASRIQMITNHSAVSWQEREKTWLTVFSAIRISTALTVTSIILISGLGMFNTLVMIVMEKTKEISILRSMGYTREDISSIFLWEGGIVLMIGTFFGVLVGAGLTFAVSHFPIRLTGIFATDSFVVSWSIWHYVAAVSTATVIVMCASVIPARRAARLEPGDVIRGTS